MTTATQSPYSGDVREGTWCPCDCPWLVSFEDIPSYCKLLREPLDYYDGELASCATNSPTIHYAILCEDIVNDSI